jgi:hypothetical protein
MGDGHEATVHRLPTADTTEPKQHKPKKKKFDLKNALKAGEPILQASFSVLEKTKSSSPYITALRLLAAAGQAYLATNDTNKSLTELKKLRKKLVSLPVDAVDERGALQRKIDKILDDL